VREIAVFGGSAHPALAGEICAFLSVPRQPVRLERFANGVPGRPGAGRKG